MILTICLVTKGRERYLDAILNSFQPVLGDSLVKILIIDNGTPSNVSKRIKNWAEKYPSSVKVVRFEFNDSRPQQTWDVLIQENSDWTVFPSDDDVFCSEIIQAWRDALEGNPNLIAFAPSARVINSVGEITGDELNPAGVQHEFKTNQIAGAFHEPPFIWPSLFMRISKLPKAVPNSRYVFDWWVGIHLMLAGQIEFSKEVGILYRVHQEQESFLAPLRRKYFEAQLWITDIIENPEFGTWIQSLNDEDRLDFWASVMNRKPIYGDPFFSRTVLLILFRKIFQSMETPFARGQILLNYAFESGTLLKDGEVMNLLPKSVKDISIFQGNVKIELDSGGCTGLLTVSKLLLGNENSRSFPVFCSHSSDQSKGIKIPCEDFTPDDSAINSDLVINVLTEFCEFQGEFDFALTSGERFLVGFVRRWRNKIPLQMRKKIKRLKNAID
jgi:hypothetical protein